MTGKAILCNGSCFTVATFQKDVQYLNMWYPVPNRRFSQSPGWLWGSAGPCLADRLDLWLSDLTPWKVLFLSDVSMRREQAEEGISDLAVSDGKLRSMGEQRDNWKCMLFAVLFFFLHTFFFLFHALFFVLPLFVVRTTRCLPFLNSLRTIHPAHLPDTHYTTPLGCQCFH